MDNSIKIYKDSIKTDPLHKTRIIYNSGIIYSPYIPYIFTSIPSREDGPKIIDGVSL